MGVAFLVIAAVDDLFGDLGQPASDLRQGPNVDFTGIDLF
jgi:hypothetical protein